MRQSINQSINREAFEKLINEKYNGKHNKLAEEIGISRVQMWRIINEHAQPGSDFLFRFTVYCEKNKLQRGNYFVEISK